jgi:hypothetical protein
LHGYVAGAIDADVSQMNDLQQCWYQTPEKGSLGQVVDVFIKYLREHPEQRHFTAHTLVLLSMTEAFPCLR